METRDTIPHVVEPSPPNGSSTLTVSFSTRITGKYTIDIGVNGERLPTCPIIRHYCAGTCTNCITYIVSIALYHTMIYDAGPVDPSKTVFLDQRQVLILIENTYYCMHVVPKDRFGNAAILLQELLTAEVRKVPCRLIHGHSLDQCTRSHNYACSSTVMHVQAVC